MKKRLEVKVWQGGAKSGFNEKMKDAKDKFLAEGGGGEVVMQVPVGSDADNLVKSFRGSAMSRDPERVKKAGWYRSMEVTIIDESGTVLMDKKPLEFPPLKTEPSPPEIGGIAPKTGLQGGTKLPQSSKRQLVSPKLKKTCLPGRSNLSQVRQVRVALPPIRACRCRKKSRFPAPKSIAKASRQ